MIRFFIRPNQITANTVTLDADDALHLDRVLRAKIGEEIGILDGAGTLFTARLTALNKVRAIAEIVGSEELSSEPRVAVTIAQAIPKTSEKLAWVLQHGVEAGACAFWVFRSRRSEAGKLAERPERWEKIVKTAAEQTGRAKLPDVAALSDMDDILAQVSEFDLALLCDEAEHALTLKQALTQSEARRILLIVGPEGGWADEERSLCHTVGVRSITLGQRILRTETAALIALSQTLYALDGG